MKSHGQIAQLILRIALGIGFLSPVFDRLGWLGGAGEKNIAWGNWDAFLNYVHVLLPWLSNQLSNFFGLMATVAEATLGVLLIIGFKTRLAAFGTFLLTLLFMLCMTATLGFKAALNYSVPAFSAGALLLSAMPGYLWSLDRLHTKTKKN
jgi:putative oxidoreductase